MTNQVPSPVSFSSQDDMYLTIKPSLKSTLDRMEANGAENKEKLLFSSATDMDANRVETNLPEYKDRVVRRPRQFWDVTLALTENRPRIRILGTAMIQRDTLKFQYRNELSCAQEMDAKQFHKELMDRSSSLVTRFLAKLINHEIRLAFNKPSPPKETVRQPPNPMLNPMVNPMVNPNTKTNPQPEESKNQESNTSQISVNQQSEKVEFVLDLVLDNPAMTQIIGITAMTAGALRVEMEVAASSSLRHILAKSVQTMGEKGISERGVQAGTYPPGVFQRTDVQYRVDREPKNRISWMAGLLPFLGHQDLFDKIKYDQSWRDSGNWMVGRTIVPQFIDLAYPDFTQQVSINNVPVDYGATHYVGIAGVGLDAASYKRGNPATKHKEGIFSYEGSASVEEIRQGRGLANTIFMIQVPHDTITGVSPWMAGGGATVRGVPEKNSIAPFVLTTNRTGKIIQHQNKRGTYAMMADGSVRFIDQNISDEAFKAMCTVSGPAPANFDLKRDPNTTLIPSPDGKDAAKPAETPAIKKESSKKTEETKTVPQ